MVEPIATGVGALPLAPRNPLSFRQRLKAVRETATGQVTLRDAGGPITRVDSGPEMAEPTDCLGDVAGWGARCSCPQERFV